MHVQRSGTRYRVWVSERVGLPNVNYCHYRELAHKALRAFVGPELHLELAVETGQTPAKLHRQSLPTGSPVQLQRRGFTLIEILVVIVVIAILASLVAPNIFQNVGAAKDATARSQIEMLGAALDAYRLDNGKYPPTALGLEGLNTKPTDESAPTWRGPYLRKAVPLDPWHHPYIYKAPGEVAKHFTGGERYGSSR